MRRHAISTTLILCQLMVWSASSPAEPSQTSFADGYDLLQSGKAAEAAAKFETGLKADPDNVLAHYYLGEAYAALQRNADARDQFRKSLKLDPSSSVAAQARERLAKLPAPAAVATVETEDVNYVPPIGKVVPAIKPLPSNPSFDDACPYPAEARRHGDTGTTVLLVLVGQDGSARKAVIDASSGSEILDQASSICVTEAAHFPPRRNGTKAVSYWGRMKVSWSFGD
ncbi:MAG: TonB family protein [Steroidobacteraceae bacterium]|jgi:TonB family protein